MKLMIADDHNTTSHAPLAQFEHTIFASGKLRMVNNRIIILGKAINRLFTRSLKSSARGSSRSNVLQTAKHRGGYFSILMGTYFQKCLPHFLMANNNALYMFDAWPNTYDTIEYYLPRLHVHTIFFSSLQTTEIFKARLPGVTSVWIPEGIDPGCYHFKPYAEKDIDVIQFGRKYDQYHEAIVTPLQAAGRKYLYEKVKGEVIFPNRQDFLEGIARTRVSICVPSSITHPERAGNVSTMTLRYLESMVAKCLVIGVLPEDMKLLFDYSPVIEIDPHDPAGQLLSILTDFDRYIPLIEKNYRILLDQHTFSQRWKQIQPYLGL